MITVDHKAENCITVAPGANMNLTPTDLAKARSAIDEADIILLQLEIPMETVEYVAKVAKSRIKSYFKSCSCPTFVRRTIKCSLSYYS